MRSIRAALSGRYSLIVAPLDAAPANLGGYGLLTNVGGRATPAQAWGPEAEPGQALGAQVGGQVFKRNGELAAGVAVLVSAGPVGKLQLVEQVQTQADGSYRYMNLPLGDLALAVIGANDLLLARARLSVEALTQQLVQDLNLAARTAVNLKLRLSESLLAAGPLSNILIDLQDEFGPRKHALNFAEPSVEGATTLYLAGDSAQLSLTHPRNARLQLKRELVGEDGTELSLDVSWLTGGVRFQTLNGTLESAGAGLMAQALGDDDQVLEQASSDAAGTVSFAVLPAEARLRLRVTDALTGLTAIGEVQPVDGLTVQAADLLLPSAAAGGLVRYQSGQVLAGVTVTVRLDNGALLEAQTDGQGRYAFARLPADQALAFTAAHPVTGAVLSQQLSAAVGDRLELADFVFEVRGTTVQGLVRNVSGRPLEGVMVMLSSNGELASCPASWPDPVPSFAARAGTSRQARGSAGASLAGDEPGEGSSRYAYTDALGRYRLDNVPAGSQLVSTAMGLVCQRQQRELEVMAVGNTQTLADFVFPDMGSVLLRIVDSAGQPIRPRGDTGGECPLRLRVTAEGFEPVNLELPELMGSRYEGVPFGLYKAQLNECGTVLAEGEVLVKDAEPINFDVVLAILNGRLNYADGSPVSNFSVWLLQRDEAGMRREVSGRTGVAEVEGGPDVANAYQVYGGFTKGAYELGVQEHGHGLHSRWLGRFDKLPTEPLHLVLPLTAQLQGCVSQADGRPAAPTRMLAFNEGLAGGWSPIGSHEGQLSGACYDFARLPAGPTVLHVFEGENLKLVHKLSLNPLSDRAPVQANLQYPTVGRALIMATGEQGQPLAEQRVIMQSQQIEQALSYSGKEAYTAGNGYAVFERLPGHHAANSVAPWWANDPRLGRSWLRLSPGQTVEISLPYANSYKFSGMSSEAPVVAEGGVSFMFGQEAKLLSYGASSYFNSWTGPSLTVNGLPLPSSLGMDYVLGQREMSLGPFEYGDKLSLRRRLYVPESGGFARLLETFSNGSTQPVTLRLASTTSGPSHCDPIRISEPQLNAARGYLAYQDCQASVAHVYASSDGGVQLPGRVDALSDRGALTQWTLTLAPGQTASLLHFHVLAEPGDVSAAAVAARAKALAEGREPQMFEGLTAQDRTTIRNFVVGP